MSILRVVPLTLMALAVAGAERTDRWVAILDGAPVAERVANRAEAMAERGRAIRAEIGRKQEEIISVMAERGVRRLGATRTLLNAIYFAGSSEDAEAIRTLPGVTAVMRMKPLYRRADDRATQLVNAPNAWSAVGGESSAGAGQRIAILDSGIDIAHPALVDDSLTPPSGFPRGDTDAFRTNFTSKKVIVARSYVDLLVLGDDPANSRPDDLTPRDRVGHGTAVAMLAAGRRVNGPAATVVGVAPKAFLGNYKIFGSPGVNDTTFSSAVAAALEDAVADGMDVATLSLGRPADWGALDLCRQGTRACDPNATAVHNAARLGLIVVVPAGNTGDSGFSLPTLGSIESPGTAPSAITVGATTNAHIYYQSLRLTGANVPASLNRINTQFGNGPVPASPVSGPLRDVATLNDDGRACRPLGNGTLNGAIALIQRGGCNLDLKVIHAQRAGALGVVMIQFENSNLVFPMRGLDQTGIPAVLIASRDGQAIKSLMRTGVTPTAALDPAVTQTNAPADEIAYFSSQGPSMGDLLLKPEISAVGTDLYLATQKFDPNGEGYSADGYRAVQGTSFAVPMVAGAAALLTQRNPNWPVAAFKSALVGTANPAIDDFDASGNRIRARVMSTGAGKLDAAAALTTQIYTDPAALSFGAVSSGTQAPALGLRVGNPGSTGVTLSVRVVQRDADSVGRIAVTPSSFNLPPGQVTQLTVRLEGGRPNPGSYEGVLEISGAGPTMRVPYLYLVGDGVPFNAYALQNDNFVSTPNAVFDGNNNPLLVKFVDRYGVPVRGLAMRWSVVSGGGSIGQGNQAVSRTTDDYGVGFAGLQLGPELGEHAFRVEAGGVAYTFAGRAIPQPAIRSGGIVDAASLRAGQGLAPGSYISIFGTGLSEVTRVFSTPYLPISLSGVSVSFDAPARRISVPGALHFVSDQQINVQIPWELQGLTSVQMKVSIGNISSAVFNVPLNEFSPGIFEYDDASSGRRVAAALDGRNAVISGANPVARGGVIQMFVNGLGRVSATPASGEPASTTTLSNTLATPEVRIGGRVAPIVFSGLAPGLVGLYQVNVTVPDDVATGVQTLTLAIGGVTSQQSQVIVR